MLGLSAASGLLYLVLTIVLVWRSKRKPAISLSTSRPAYVWGFLFSALFYYGIPLWWWRYGLRHMLYVLFVCFLVGAITQGALVHLGLLVVNSLADSVSAGLFLSVPIRAGAGLWIARRDGHWRERIKKARSVRATT